MVVGSRIRLLRRAHGMSQQDLGNIIGVSKVSVSGYESGSRIPSVQVLNKLLNFFEVSADYLLGREIDMVCENDEDLHVFVSSIDINIIKELKNNRNLYTSISKDPKRFFANMAKNNI